MILLLLKHDFLSAFSCILSTHWGTGAGMSCGDVNKHTSALSSL